MKKTILILGLVSIILIGAKVGQDLIINTGRIDGFLYGDASGGIDTLLIADVDSTGQYKIANLRDPIDPLDAVNYRTFISASGAGWDSIPFDPSSGDLDAYQGAANVYSTNLDGRYIEFSDTTVLFPSLTQFLDSILEVKTLISTSLEQSIFTIKLPAASTVAGRVSGAVEGTDYPSGWVISAGANPANLDINHGLGKRVVNVTVFYNTTGTIYQQARNFSNAYTAIFSTDTDNIRIESLYTGQTAIEIYLVFTQ